MPASSDRGRGMPPSAARRKRRRALSAVGWTLAAALMAGLAGYSIVAAGSGGTDDPARIAAPVQTAESERPTGTAPADPGSDASEPARDSGTPDAPGDTAEPEVAEDAALAEQEQPVAEPVALDEPAATGPFTVSVSKVAAIQGEADGIGEVAGPAVRFVLTVRNTSEAALPLDAAVVTVDYGDDAVPATQLSQSGAKDFPDTVAAGKSASGTFVFQVPVKERDSVRILFNHSASEPVVAFEGPAPTRKG